METGRARRNAAGEDRVRRSSLGAPQSAGGFSAIDVETANADPASICEIGIVHACGGAIRAEWSTLVNPGMPFTPGNTALHGIDARAVRDAPAIPQIYGSLSRLLAGTTVVSHTPFDRVALAGAERRYGLPAIRARWVDSAAVARAAWPRPRSRGGWGLAAVAGRLGITFRHHVAVEDARVAAEIVLRARVAIDADRAMCIGGCEWRVPSVTCPRM